MAVLPLEFPAPCALAHSRKVSHIKKKKTRPATKASQPRKPQASPPAALSNDISLRMIIVSSKDRAEDILGRIKKGGSFARIAKAESLDRMSGDKYGYLGAVKRDSLDKNVVNALKGLKEGQVSGAIPLEYGLYGIVQEIDPALYGKGEAAFRQGDYASASRYLGRYVDVNPDASVSRIMLGKILESEKRFPEALDMYKKAVEFHPEFGTGYLLLGRLYLKLGRYQEALDTFSEGLKHSKSDLLEEGRVNAEILLEGRKSGLH